MTLNLCPGSMFPGDTFVYGGDLVRVHTEPYNQRRGGVGEMYTEMQVERLMPYAPAPGFVNYFHPEITNDRRLRDGELQDLHRSHFQWVTLPANERHTLISDKGQTAKRDRSAIRYYMVA